MRVYGGDYYIYIYIYIYISGVWLRECGVVPVSSASMHERMITGAPAACATCESIISAFELKRGLNRYI